MLQQAPQETSRLSRQVLQGMRGVSSQRIEMALDIIGSVARVEGINGSDIVKKPAVTLDYFCGILREDSAQGHTGILTPGLPSTVSLRPLHISQQIPEGMTVFLPATARQERPGLTYVWQPNALSRRQFDGQRPGSPPPVLFRNPKDD
ncbi:hypothetical protein CPAR01_05732 [Colletotrichum paranaense]|uniref:Uncharacterized protein n=1 Tax=Colletotrichum paranaense TaxID=1914294 RepID=A0ABQ9SSP9_9PEZI|nr:uncharacterized protein CPAR01_05732 [Colletotrichum paranaense]KAK1542345.1 hypothetical protein CPAR01_05732 [Colletotrichum paranaense]